MNIIEFLDNPELNPEGFDGGTRDTMRSVLKAAWALPMDGKDLELFQSVAGGRQPPSKRVNRLVVIAGRRAEKTRTAALSALYLATVGAAVEGLSDKLKAGERGVVSIVACDRAQASIALRYIRGLVEASPVLNRMVNKQGAEEIHFNNDVSIEVSTNSFRAIRGRTLLAVIFDEAAYFRSESTANPDVELYRAALPGLATTGGMMIIISSPYAKKGLVYDQHKKHFGKSDPEVLVIQGASRQFNPLIAEALIAEALADDPEGAAAEWLGQFRSDVASFVQREVVDQAVRSSPLMLPHDAKHQYAAFVDPSGGGKNGDEFTLAIGHKEGDLLVVDAVHGRTGVPAAITAEYAAILKEYKITEVTGDRYAGSWPGDEFAKHGIKYQQAEKPRTGLYLDLLPILNSGQIEIPDDAKLINQICALERTTGRGRDVIDHPRGAHDDRANVVAGLSSIKRGSGYCVACFVHGTEGCSTHGQKAESKQERPRPAPQRDHPANIF